MPDRQIDPILDRDWAAVNSVGAFAITSGSLVGAYTRDSVVGIVWWNLKSGEKTSRFEVPIDSPHPITSVAFSGDGRTVGVTCPTGNLLTLIDSKTGRTIREFRTNGANAVILSGDGTRVATADERDRVTVRTLDQLTTARTFEPTDGAHSTAMALSSDGRFFALGTDQGQAIVWDLRSGEQVRGVGDSSSSSPVRALAISDDSNRRYFAVGHEKGGVRVWDLSTGKKANHLRSTEFAEMRVPVRSLRFSPGGRRLAVGRGKWTQIWDPISGTHPVSEFVNGGQQLSFSGDGSRLAAIALDGAVKTIAVRQIAQVAELDEPWAPLRDVNENGDSQTFSIDVDQSFHGAADTYEIDAPLQFYSIAFSPDGEKLAAGTAAEIVLVNARRGTRDGIIDYRDIAHRTLDTTKPGGEIVFSDDGKDILSTIDSPLIRRFSVATRALIRHPGDGEAIPGLELPFSRHDSYFAPSLVFSPNGRLVLVCDTQLRLSLWDTRAGTRIRSIVELGRPTSYLALSRDARFAAVMWFGSIQICDVMNRKRIRVLPGPFSPGAWLDVFSVAFSPDAKQVVLGFKNSEVSIWSVSSGARLRTLALPNVVRGRFANVITYSPDGSEIAAGLTDGTVYTWDAVSGVGRHAFSRRGPSVGVHSFPGITAIAYSPNGEQLASADERRVTVRKIKGRTPAAWGPQRL